MNKSIQTLRELAKVYRDLAGEDINNSRLVMHQQVNDLQSTRPVVLIGELPWNEMNIDNQLTLVCKEPVLRAVEDYLRKSIFQYKRFPADMVLKPYISIKKVVDESSIGITKTEDTLASDEANTIVSHEYHDQLSNDSDVDKLILPTITYNEKETMRRYDIVANALGDIIPIKISGIDYMQVLTWDDVSEFRGVTPLLMDIIDRPEHSHKIIRKLTDIYVHRLNSYENLGLFSDDPDYLHSTAMATNDLKKPAIGKPRTREHVWGRGVAQILASVSKEMRDEFDIAYMQETVGQCGLTYYGCCEPLDTMIDIVEKIKNLRKISITPWANVDNAADIIGNRYVLASKPNPSAVAVKALNEDSLRKELDQILSACKRNNCHADIVLKDISTCNNNPNNIFRWEQIAMEMVNSY